MGADGLGSGQEDFTNEALLAQTGIVSTHPVLSDRTRGLIGAEVEKPRRLGRPAGRRAHRGLSPRYPAPGRPAP